MKSNFSAKHLNVILYNFNSLIEIKERIKGATKGKVPFIKVYNKIPKLFPEYKNIDFLLTTNTDHGSGGLWRLRKGINNFKKGTYSFGSVDILKPYYQHYVYYLTGKETINFKSNEAATDFSKSLNFIAKLRDSYLFYEKKLGEEYKEIIEKNIDFSYESLLDKLLSDYLEETKARIAVILENGHFMCMKFEYEPLVFYVKKI